MTSEHAYEPFANQEWRNVLQSALEVKLAAKLLHVPKGLRVLEVGCGRGIALAALTRVCQPASLAALDIDPALLEVARANAREQGLDVTFVEGDVRNMPFDDAAFDLVVDFGTCYHVARPEAALAEIERVLAPGGLFVCESPIAQLLAHPSRSTRRRLPWQAAPLLVPHHCAGLWASRVKLAWPGR